MPLLPEMSSAVVALSLLAGVDGKELVPPPSTVETSGVACMKSGTACENVEVTTLKYVHPLFGWLVGSLVGGPPSAPKSYEWQGLAGVVR